MIYWFVGESTFVKLGRVKRYFGLTCRKTSVLAGREVTSETRWQLIEPLLLEEPPKPKGGTIPRVPDPPTLVGILFVLKTYVPWETLPNRWAAAPP